MKHYLIYQIRNKFNGMIYVGKHQTEDLNDGYMGSGIRIVRAIEKYGIDNFEKIILFECQSLEEMNAKEAEIVDEEFIARDDVYNIKVGGDGGWDYVNSNKSNYGKGSKRRHDAMILANKNRNKEEFSANIKKALASIPDEIKKQRSQKLSVSLKTTFQNDPSIIEKRSNKQRGKKRTLQQRKKMSLKKQGCNNNQYGKVWIMNRTLKQCKCVNRSYVLPIGWEYGRCYDFDAAEQKKVCNEKRLLAIEQHKNNRLMFFRNMYKFFTEHNNDFELTAKQFNYNHTRNAFMTACKILLPEYKPLPNNRWKNRK